MGGGLKGLYLLGYLVFFFFFIPFLHFFHLPPGFSSAADERQERSPPPGESERRGSDRLETLVNIDEYRYEAVVKEV